MIVAQRLRKGSCGSARGAARLVADTLATVKRLRSTGATGPVLLRADSAFYGHKVVAAARRAKADVSITVRQTTHIKAAISTIARRCLDDDQVPEAVFDEPSGRWISRAEVAEIGFTAFTSRKNSEQVPGRLVVRRIPDLNPKAVAGQPTLFDTWRFHAFFTTSTLDTVTFPPIYGHLRCGVSRGEPAGSAGPQTRWGCAFQCWNADALDYTSILTTQRLPTQAARASTTSSGRAVRFAWFPRMIPSWHCRSNPRRCPSTTIDRHHVAFCPTPSLCIA